MVLTRLWTFDIFCAENLSWSHLYMHAETGLWIIESKLVKCLAAVADLSNRCSIFLLNSFLGLDITLLPWCSLLESFRILSLQSQRYSDMSAWTLLNSWVLIPMSLLIWDQREKANSSDFWLIRKFHHWWGWHEKRNWHVIKLITKLDNLIMRNLFMHLDFWRFWGFWQKIFNQEYSSYKLP